MTRKRLPVFCIFAAQILSACAHAQQIKQSLAAGPPLLSCTSASPGPVTTSTAKCDGMIFSFSVLFRMSNGTTITTSLPSSTAFGVCALTYPACESYNSITPPEQLPTVTQFTVTLAGNRANYKWVINQPSIAEAGPCACPSEADRAANPNGFLPLIPGSVRPVTVTSYEQCP